MGLAYLPISCGGARGVNVGPRQMECLGFFVPRRTRRREVKTHAVGLGVSQVVSSHRGQSGSGAAGIPLGKTG